MLNSDTNLYTIPLPITPNYHILCSSRDSIRTRTTVMTWINLKEEGKIDILRNNILTLVRGDKTFELTCNKIYCYGKVDFNDEEDLDIIDNFKFLSHLTDRGIAIYSRYDYNTHTCKSTSKRLMWKECFSPAELATYAHGMLGKPERIVLFDI